MIHSSKPFHYQRSSVPNFGHRPILQQLRQKPTRPNPNTLNNPLEVKNDRQGNSNTVLYSTPASLEYSHEDRSRAQTTPNWPEQAEDAFSTMVSNNTNLDTAKSVWPYDEKIENNFNGASISISPNSGLDSDYTG